jgi:hypothetical protein
MGLLLFCFCAFLQLPPQTYLLYEAQPIVPAMDCPNGCMNC